jgi:cell division protein FtsW (lipid II flippase)
MAYLNLMILVSRYVFTGFALIFTLIVLSSIKPFVTKSLGNFKGKNSLLFMTLLFFHVGASSILLGKADSKEVQFEIVKNSGIFLGILVILLLVYRIRKKQEQLFIIQIVLFLLDVGYIMLERLNPALAAKHMIWTAIGSLALLMIDLIGKRFLKQSFQYIYLLFFIGGMLLPFAFGVTANGAMNWVDIGGFTFQPSEIGKLLLVLFLAAIFSRQKVGKKEILFSGGVVAFSLIFLVLQTDLGGAFLYYVTFLWMLLIATQKPILPFGGVIGGGIAGVIGYELFSHVRVRVHNWLDPWQDVSGRGYQVVQGLFAMGTWGWFGSGLTRGIPQRIPYASTDYIFAAICEEFGNLFAILLLALYMGLIIYIFKIALMQKNAFYKMAAAGIGIILGIQILMIVGGVLKIIPLTGVTLPFISYGGSSLLTSCAMIGLILCFMNLKEEKKKEDGVSEKRR